MMFLIFFKKKAIRRNSAYFAVLYAREVWYNLFMRYKMQIIHYGVCIIAVISAFFTFVAPKFTQASTPETGSNIEIEVKSDEIKDLEKQISQYEIEIGNRHSYQHTLNNDIAILDARAKKARLEIRRLDLLVKRLSNDVSLRETQIIRKEENIVRIQGIIASQLKTLAQDEVIPTILLFVADGQFSDFFIQLQALEVLQSKLHSALQTVRSQKDTLEVEREKLFQQKIDNEQLKDLQEATRGLLTRNSNQKQDLLIKTRGEERGYQKLVKTSKADIENLKNEIYYLQRIGVTAEQAATLGVLVAERIGIRPAYLIAILEIESRLGANVGSGTWKKDMHPRDHEAFFHITQGLGLNPDTTPVSKKPNYGWGGAMGPAQFLPNTWLGYKDRIAAFSGHNPPNPWNIEDAFFAAAIKLHKDGASSKTAVGEIAAAKTYIGGSPYCSKSICNYYANLAIDKAADIERSL